MNLRGWLVTILTTSLVGVSLLASAAAAGSFDASSTTVPVDTVPASTTLGTIPPGGSAVPTTAVSPVSLTGPTVKVGSASAKLGRRVLFTASGFQSTTITATICGNNALNGSGDCDQPHGVSIGALRPGATVSEYLTVAKPPMPCPCVVRVTNDTGDEVAVTPFKVVGHKTAPLVRPPAASVDNSLLQLSITATPAKSGFWSATAGNLGGSVTYDVTVAVQNKTDANLHDLLASGAVGRDSNDTIQSFALEPMPAIPPGFVWQQKLRITLPAPSIGDYHWRLSVSHNGVPVTQELVTRHRPWLLIGLVLFILFDVAVLIVRARLRARAKRGAASNPDNGSVSVEASTSDLVGADH